MKIFDFTDFSYMICVAKDNLTETQAIKEISNSRYYPRERVWTIPKKNNKSLSLLSPFFKGDPLEWKQQESIFFEINPSYIFVSGNELDIIFIKESFVYYEKIRVMKNRRWIFKDIKRYIAKIIEGRPAIPVGFSDDLFCLLLTKNIKFTSTEKRNNYLPEPPGDNKIKKSLPYLSLYDYQVDCVRECLKMRSGIIKLPTGSGKTEIFLSLCTLIVQESKTMNILIVCPKIDIATQTLQRSKKAGLDSGLVQGDTIEEDHRIVICTIQSVRKLRKEYQTVIIDECHKAGSKEYNKLLSKEFTHRFGFSATPSTGNPFRDAKIKQFIGCIIFTLDSSFLMSQNKIAQPSIYITDILYPEINYSVWMQIEKYGIINNSIRNLCIAKIANSTEKTMILIKNISHGTILQSMIPNSIFVSGKDKKEIREDAINKFIEDPQKTLIASTIFDEGISIDCIQNLIIAAGGKSIIKTIQRIGRGLRISENKKSVNIYDFNDAINPVLERHSEKRIAEYINNGFVKIYRKIQEK